jgi:NhaP-type Na+/H+ or K+/H+ antiporter
VVVFTLALAASTLGTGTHSEASGGGGALADLAVGVGVGLAIGLVAAALVSSGSRRRWIVAGGRRLAALAAAFSSFALAVASDGNGFIAAFVAGIAFGAAVDKDVVELEHVIELPELLGEVMALVVWFLFGAVLVPVAVHGVSPAMVAYALLSLTVVRMVPVAASLAGSGQDRSTVLFVGWFGPRGLASVVFALLAVEELGETPTVDLAVGAVALTVLLSVLLHGVSAGPLGARYAAHEESAEAHHDAPLARRAGHRLTGQQ